MASETDAQDPMDSKRLKDWAAEFKLRGELGRETIPVSYISEIAQNGGGDDPKRRHLG